ncbi:MAG: reverse transcriptase domain-containing protein [Planctomycetota bacterium]|nr:reverse transcriptase domain-containing protein [Planctomycetota bacterium]
MGKLIEVASELETLHRAWRLVRAQVRRTAWPQLSAELGRMESDPLRHLREIQRKLRTETYAFAPKWGYTKRKSGGSRRGITVHCVHDRIVQRAILCVLHSSEERLRRELGRIPEILDCPTSFAGNPKRGVPEAIGMIVEQLRQGQKFVALSDVKDFFPLIPRERVTAFVAENIHDAAFCGLFAAALETELANHADLERWLSLFPLDAVGVAQGSMLSVFAGNIALRDFDVELNANGMTTVRYLDDFAILTSDRGTAEAGFALAQRLLSELGMSCYAPCDGSQKGVLTSVADGFDFLGCRVHPSGISPSRRARQQLPDGVASLLRDGRGAEAGYAQILTQIDRKVRGWGDAFRFITNRVAFAQLDREIDRQLAEFRGWYARLYRLADGQSRRRLDGIALLSETPPDTFGEPDHRMESQ